MSQQPIIESILLSKQPKSSLNLTQQKLSNKQIQYIKQTNENDQNQHPLSDQERQTEINRLRQEYIMEKINRKKQIMKIKREEFGSSSSEDDDVGVQQSEDDEDDRKERDKETGQVKVKQNNISQNNHKDQQCPLNKPQKVYLLKTKQAWVQQYFIMKQTSLFFNDKQIQLSRIHKIKSLPNQTPYKNHHRLKISQISQQIILAVSRDILFYKKQKLSLHYLIFSNIILKKLQKMGLKFYSLQKNVPGVPESVIKNCLIYGKIFKKSQILGRWEQRLVVINQMGIYSYKRFNQQHSMFIAANSVKQIWTRFEIVDQNLLVIKLLHSSNTKTQFGIPLTDFMNQRNWLYQFYNLCMK